MSDPYLAITLDAKRRIAQVARALDQPHPGTAGSGFLELLEDVWRRKDPAVSAEVLAACFGPDPRIGPMLASFGFLVAKGGAWELCAKEADRLLSTHRQRVAAGKARAAGAERSGGAFTSGPPAADQRTTSGPPAADQLLQPAASSQQPAAEDLAAGAAGPVEPPAAAAHERLRPVLGDKLQKPRQRAQAPARATNGGGELVLEAQTPHEPDRARQELIAAICADFAATHDGAKYRPNEKLDFKALDRMRKAHGDAEVLSRCRNGFRTKYGGAAYIWEIEQKWNKFATPEQTTKTAQERAAESRDTSRDWSTWDGEF